MARGHDTTKQRGRGSAHEYISLGPNGEVFFPLIQSAISQQSAGTSPEACRSQKQGYSADLLATAMKNLNNYNKCLPSLEQIHNSETE